MNSVRDNSFCQILLVGICLHCFAFVQPIGTDSGRREMEAEETMTTVVILGFRLQTSTDKWDKCPEKALFVLNNKCPIPPFKGSVICPCEISEFNF